MMVYMQSSTNVIIENALKAKWQQPHPNSFFADFVRLSRNVEIIDEEGKYNTNIFNVNIYDLFEKTNVILLQRRCHFKFSQKWTEEIRRKQRKQQ